MRAIVFILLLNTCCDLTIHSVFAARLEPTFGFLEEEKTDYDKIWVLLVAGSNQYFNYRHQADICHAYHVVRNHGINDDNIVVMMYDDIAFNSMNPTQGVILNRPDGPNVYEGVPKHFTGRDVSPKNFLNVLQGKSDAVNGKKVIQRKRKLPDQKPFHKGVILGLRATETNAGFIKTIRHSNAVQNNLICPPQTSSHVHK